MKEEGNSEFTIHHSEFRIASHTWFSRMVSKICRVYVASAAGHEVFRLYSSLDSPSCAQRRAVECGHGVRKVQNPPDFPARQQSVNESAMEDVPCAGGIHGFDDESR